MIRKRRQRLNYIDSIFFLLLILSITVSAPIFMGFGFETGIIFLFVIFGILLILFIIFSLPSVKGKMGERAVNKKLIKVQKKLGGYIINDLMIVDENNKSSQIDHIYLCTKGIFVIETKNYKGRIYGSEDQMQWTQVLSFGNVKHKLYNPIKQNLTHIIRLKNYLKINEEIFSLVVFTSNNTSFIDSFSVCPLSELKNYLLGYEADLFTNEEIASIYDELMKLKINRVKTNKEHVQEIKKMKKDINNNICPRCGGELVLRKSQTGSFYGCSNYPKCKFTKKI